MGASQPEVRSVFIEQAKKQNAPIVFVDEKYKAVNIRHENVGKLFLTMDIRICPPSFSEGAKGDVFNLQCELLGFYQQKNITTVLCATELLNDKGFNLSEDSIRKGIKNVITETGLLGRWQILSKEPLVIADTGHNEAGIKEVMDQIKQTPHDQLHFVLGMVNDKDISKILQLLPKDAVYYFCKAQIPRALNSDELAHQANAAGLKGEVFGSVVHALTAAKSKAKKNDLVFVGGSTFTVAEVI
ncbi:MAG: glutamate ligase domain-containing protein [Bacteroidota bacterium]